MISLFANGERYGRLEIVAIEHFSSGERFYCICDCGEFINLPANRVLSDHVKSCGCLKVETGRANGLAQRRHGHTSGPKRSRTWISWSRMRERVFNPNHVKHHLYAHVAIDPRWNSFENFLEDMGERPADTSLDRIDPHGDYTKANCRWADVKTQRHNRRAT